MAEKKNFSSGAEKAEKLTKKGNTSSGGKGTEESSELASLANKSSNKKSSKKTKSVKKEGGASKSASKKKASRKPKKVSEKRAAKLKKREEKRLERAKLVAERRRAREQKKLDIKREKAQNKAALAKKKQQLKAERKKRKEMIKSESKEARAKRIAQEKQAKREAAKAKREARFAERKAKREHALKVREQKRAERNDRRRAPGFGGWLAAVITLGVTTLALGTVVTFGWLNMNEMQADMEATYTQSLYELNSVVDNLDANLSRAMVSSSAGDRVRVLTDIAIESETAETILERFPLDMQMTEQISSFVNKMGDSAKGMLYTVANGGELTSSQRASLEYMYETNQKLKAELNSLVTKCDGKDLMNAMRGKSSLLGDGFTVIQNNTFETPKGIQDGPFSDSVKTDKAAAVDKLKEITAPEAEKLAAELFKDYKVTKAKCTGEVEASAFTLYNVRLATSDGEMLVQLTKKGSKVVSFDSFKDCKKHNFSVERCIDIAEDFLTAIGYEGLMPVWTSENGTTCNLNFAPVQDGVILYPDLIKVKVCEERGIVTGVEAASYVMNHTQRKLATPVVGKAEAQAAISGDISVKGARRALIPLDGKEILCYEFFGKTEGGEYFVYVDAITGEEVEVLTVIGTKQGRALM